MTAAALLRLARAATVVVGAGLAAACGTDPYPGQPDVGTHRVALVSEMNGFDPARASEEVRTICVLNVYDALYEYHPTKRPYELKPCLADGMPEVSADGVTWTVRLKAGVRYVDDPCFPGGTGREVRASDVVFDVLRLMDAHTVSPGSWVLDGRLEGLAEFVAASEQAPKDPRRAAYGAPLYPGVAGVTAPDAHTVVFRLTEPYPQFGWVLAMGYLSVYPPEAVAHYGEEFLNHAVGTGPFRIASYEPARQLVLVRNPTYREETFPEPGDPADQATGVAAEAGRRLPQCDRVIATVVKEDQPRWLWFEAGHLDRAGIPKDAFGAAVDPATGELLPRLADRGVRLWKEPWIEILFDVFNLKDPVVGGGEKGLALRRAISLATDYAWASKHLYNGRTDDMQGAIPRECVEYDPTYRNPWKPAPGESRADALARARAELARGGWRSPADVPPLTMEVLDSATDDDHFAAWQRDLADLGLRLRPNKTNWQGQDQRIQKGQFQVAGYAWSADYPEAQNFLQLLYGPNHPPGPNASSFSDPECDRLYQEALPLPPSPERTSLYRRMQARALDQAPWVVRYRRVGYLVTQPWLHGFKPMDISQKLFKYARVDADRRRALVGTWNAPRLGPPLAALGVAVLLAGAAVAASRRGNRRGW